jgi:uncharacterized membrane protein
MTISNGSLAHPNTFDWKRPTHSKQAHATERAIATVVVLVIDAVAVVLTMAGAHGPLRLLFGLAFVLVVPGWAVIGFLRLNWPAAEVSLTIGLSLAITLLGSEVMLWTHTWHPVTYQLILGIIAAGLMAEQLRRFVKEPAQPS